MTQWVIGYCSQQRFMMLYDVMMLTVSKMCCKHVLLFPIGSQWTTLDHIGSSLAQWEVCWTWFPLWRKNGIWAKQEVVFPTPYETVYVWLWVLLVNNSIHMILFFILFPTVTCINNRIWVIIIFTKTSW